jgi:hypothetical protein
MTARTNKVRLVVGLFGTAKELASALAELSGAHGMTSSQLNLVAQSDALRGSLAAWAEKGKERGFDSWMVYRPEDGTVPWAIGATGPEALTAAANGARALLGFHHWPLRRQAEQLHRHLREGRALLLVETQSDAEERAACTALLRHASGGVQTHEIARSQEAETPPNATAT